MAFPEVSLIKFLWDKFELCHRPMGETKQKRLRNAASDDGIISSVLRKSQKYNYNITKYIFIVIELTLYFRQ